MSEAKEKCKANPGVEPAWRAAWVAESGKVYKIKPIKRPRGIFVYFFERPKKARGSDHRGSEKETSRFAAAKMKAARRGQTNPLSPDYLIG
jgi:hypothetical protein